MPSAAPPRSVLRTRGQIKRLRLIEIQSAEKGRHVNPHCHWSAHDRRHTPLTLKTLFQISYSFEYWVDVILTKLVEVLPRTPPVAFFLMSKASASVLNESGTFEMWLPSSINVTHFAITTLLLLGVANTGSCLIIERGIFAVDHRPIDTQYSLEAETMRLCNFDLCYHRPTYRPAPLSLHSAKICDLKKAGGWTMCEAVILYFKMGDVASRLMNLL